MSTAVIEPKPTEEVFDAAKFFADRNAREAARQAGKVEAPKVEDKPAAPEKSADKSDKPSGDKRNQQKLFRTIRENGELRAQQKMLEERLAALEGKAKPETVAAPDASKGPERHDFASDQEHLDARTEWMAKKTTEAALKAKDTEAAQIAENQRISKQFEAQMQNAGDPDKGGYADWSELLKTSKAANIDIYAASPEIFGAFISSDVAREVMHEWLLHPEALESLLETAKTDLRSAMQRFHRLEGRLEKRVDEPTEKAVKNGVSNGETVDNKDKHAMSTTDKPKPRPTASVRAPAGDAVPDEPAPGTKAWMERRNAGIKSRGW